jgi:hypothetical protein
MTLQSAADATVDLYRSLSVRLAIPMHEFDDEDGSSEPILTWTGAKG